MEIPQTTTVKTPEPESEPPQSNTVTKPLIPPPLTNGVLKRHKPLHQQPYKECMKNHAAAMGGHAIDGCGEFMPSPTYPTSLKCAACSCHRNFHRRDPDESLFPSPTTIQHVIEYQPHHRHHPPPPPPPPATVSPGNSPSPPPISSSYYPSAPHMLLALSSGVSAPAADNNHNNNISPNKKRFRTKFSQGQKERMQEFAEQVGWKMHKRHEDTIFAFCNQIGVDKNVFKVWMHNNKSNSTTKTNIISSAAAAGGEGIDFIISTNNQQQEHEPQLHLHNDTGGGNVICPKGSSTS